MSMCQFSWIGGVAFVWTTASWHLGHNVYLERFTSCNIQHDLYFRRQAAPAPQNYDGNVRLDEYD